MAVSGIFVCPDCGKAPVPGTDAKGIPIFVCCRQGGERSFGDLTKLPTKPPNPSDPDIMPRLRPWTLGGDAVLQSYSMRFDGHLLNRGFWLYVWEIKGPLCHYVYVGRTGDSSSPHASSPFKRIGQHLDPGPNAKGNALGKQLKRAVVQYEECSFEMVAIGPIWPEQADFEGHKPIRDQMAALERAIADELRQRAMWSSAPTPELALRIKARCSKSGAARSQVPGR